MRKRFGSIVLNICYTATVLTLAYCSYGILTTFVISGGFVIGLALWLMVPQLIDYQRIKLPFWATMFVFLVLHKTEEIVLKFQDELSRIIGSPPPDFSAPTLVALGVLSILGWLAIPSLVSRGYQTGSFLAWTFFASMGITELAHFAFPLFREEPYGFFPGMASVVVLAPLGWWGLYRAFPHRPV